MSRDNPAVETNKNLLKIAEATKDGNDIGEWVSFTALELFCNYGES